MTAREEMEAVYIYQSLTEAGYLIAQDGERWKVTEPKSREMPQQRLGLKTLREVQAWADGCELIRMVLGRKD